MKNLFALLFLVLLVPIGLQAQSSQSAPDGMVKIDVQEAAELEAYASYVAYKAQGTELKTVPGIFLREIEKNQVVTNHEGLPDLLKEFYDGAVHSKTHYGPKLEKLKQVKYIDTEDYGFMGSVSKDGTTILLNSSLIEYPNLARVIFLRQMGNLYDVPEASKHAHDIMSPHWLIDKDHEDLAKRLREHHVQRKRFFDALAEKNPIKARL